MEVKALLQRELLARFKKNPRYSLRAFARSLEIEPSMLSKILRGKRPVSSKVRVRVLSHFGLPNVTPEMTNEKEFQPIGEAAFDVIKDWYHYAIIELTKIKGFHSSPEWIAKALDLSVLEARAAVERLIRLGLIKVDSKGKFTEGPSNYSIADSADRSLAALAHQKAILEKALSSLDHVPYHQRENSGMTMAINTSRLTHAENLIRKFRRDLMTLLEDANGADEVYQLVVALYPVSRVKKISENKTKVGALKRSSS